MFGLRNMPTVIGKLRDRRSDADFVEIMACPSGCLNGGGQLRDEQQTSTSTTTKTGGGARTTTLLERVTARQRERVLVPSSDDATCDAARAASSTATTTTKRRGDVATQLWREWHGERDERWSLRTTYQVRTTLTSNPLSIKW